MWNIFNHLLACLCCADLLFLIANLLIHPVHFGIENSLTRHLNLRFFRSKLSWFSQYELYMFSNLLNIWHSYVTYLSIWWGEKYLIYLVHKCQVTISRWKLSNTFFPRHSFPLLEGACHFAYSARWHLIIFNPPIESLMKYFYDMTY